MLCPGSRYRTEPDRSPRGAQGRAIDPLLHATDLANFRVDRAIRQIGGMKRIAAKSRGLPRKTDGRGTVNSWGIYSGRWSDDVHHEFDIGHRAGNRTEIVSKIEENGGKTVEREAHVRAKASNRSTPCATRACGWILLHRCRSRWGPSRPQQHSTAPPLEPPGVKREIPGIAGGTEEHVIGITLIWGSWSFPKMIAARLAQPCDRKFVHFGNIIRKHPAAPGRTHPSHRGCCLLP